MTFASRERQLSDGLDFPRFDKHPTSHDERPRTDEGCCRHGGTGYAYSNFGCRCFECTEANRAKVERRRAQRKREGPPKQAHGSSSTYSNW